MTLRTVSSLGKPRKEIYGVVIAKNAQVDVLGTDRQRSLLRNERRSKSGPHSGKPFGSPRPRDSAVRNPLQEYLQVCTDGETSWISCSSCGHVLCDAGEDWIDACSSTLFPPTKAGPLMEILEGKFMFEQWSCPSCGVSLKVDMVDKPEAESAV